MCFHNLRCYSCMDHRCCLSRQLQDTWIASSPPHLIVTFGLVSLLQTRWGFETINLTTAFFYFRSSSPWSDLEVGESLLCLRTLYFVMTLSLLSGLYCSISPVCFKITGIHLIKFLDFFFNICFFILHMMFPLLGTLPPPVITRNHIFRCRS